MNEIYIYCGYSEIAQKCVQMIYSAAVTIFDDPQNIDMIQWDKKCELKTIE